MKTIRRTIVPEVRITDEKKGIAEYVASDQTLDSYREIIRADGWRFNYFAKNAPFVDSHDYGSVDKLLGRVLSFEVQGKQLVETVQWALDVPEQKLASLGWGLTKGGYLKAVSVGFRPVKYVSRYDQNPAGFQGQMADLGLQGDQMNVRTIFTEQEQLELSSVILGANPNALAKAYKEEALTDADLQFLANLDASMRAKAYEEDEEAEADGKFLAQLRGMNFRKRSEAETANSTDDPAHVELAQARAAEQFLEQLKTLAEKL